MEIELDCSYPVRSLCWSDNCLIDWAAGGRKLWPELRDASRAEFASGTDSATTYPGAGYVATYQRLGTEGLILKDGAPYRSISRDRYQAHVFDYPITIFKLNGRAVIAHCPKKYSEIEIEDLETGERLDTGIEQDDFFHSRLQASPSGNRLLSAGWIWHPVETAIVVDCHSMAAIYPPSGGSPLEASFPPDEISTAAFLNESQILIVSSFDANGYDEPGTPHVFPASSIGILDVETGELRSVQWLEEEAGTIMPVGQAHAMGFYDHPKLFDIATGKVVRRWTNIPSGSQLSSLSRAARVPPMALDSINRRFAVAAGTKVHIITDIQPV